MSRQQSLKVAPALLYIHRAANENYSPVIEMGEPRKPKIPVNNFAFFEDEFRERLQTLLEEIFGNETPFTQTESANTATSVLCAKGKSSFYFPASPILKETTISPFCNRPISIVAGCTGRGIDSSISEIT